MDIVEKLKARQKELAISDRKFAVILGMSDMCWNYVKHGKRRPSLGFLQAVARVFPEMQADCLEALLRSAPTKKTQPHEAGGQPAGETDALAVKIALNEPLKSGDSQSSGEQMDPPPPGGEVPGEKTAYLPVSPEGEIDAYRPRSGAPDASPGNPETHPDRSNYPGAGEAAAGSARGADEGGGDTPPGFRSGAEGKLERATSPTPAKEPAINFDKSKKDLCPGPAAGPEWSSPQAPGPLSEDGDGNLVERVPIIDLPSIPPGDKTPRTPGAAPTPAAAPGPGTSKTYKILLRNSNPLQWWEGEAGSAQEACEKAGWLIGDCWVLQDNERKSGWLNVTAMAGAPGSELRSSSNALPGRSNPEGDHHLSEPRDQAASGPDVGIAMPASLPGPGVNDRNISLHCCKCHKFVMIAFWDGPAASLFNPADVAWYSGLCPKCSTSNWSRNPRWAKEDAGKGKATQERLF